VLLSPTVMQGVVGTSFRLAGLQVLSSVAGPQAWLQEPSVSPQLFTETLVIAPESAGLLVQRLQQVQSGLWRGVTNLNVPWSLAAVLGDKAATAVWLHGHGFRTPPAWVLSHEVACRLQALRVADPWDATAWCSSGVSTLAGSQCGLYVLKPRDGCGCGDVQLLRLDHQQFRMVCAEGERVLDSVPGSDLCWLLQPLQVGLPCSVGFVGSGQQQFVQTPVGQQSVVCKLGRFGYEGGSVPAEPTVQQRAWPLLHQLGMALGVFRGWVGVDFVFGEQLSVIEVNPRLCTSYLGYRQLLRGNLAALLLGGSSDLDGCRAIEWGQQVIVF
jgi:predicted ATP-grasp superfamily ATP-dependent carboligase